MDRSSGSNAGQGAATGTSETAAGAGSPTQAGTGGAGGGAAAAPVPATGTGGSASGTGGAATGTGGSASGTGGAATGTGGAATGGSGAGAGATSSGASSTGVMPAALPVALKVSFTLNTPDGLRQIAFGLEKDSDGVKVNWTITFTLYERANKNTDFGGPIVSLNVFVPTTLHSNAETASHGLTPAQTAHVTGPAANAAKAAHAGTMPLPVANNVIQGSIK
jgi:hypothetical protein